MCFEIIYLFIFFKKIEKESKGRYMVSVKESLIKKDMPPLFIGQRFIPNWVGEIQFIKIFIRPFARENCVFFFLIAKRNLE